jgi:hypothetical protein
MRKPRLSRNTIEKLMNGMRVENQNQQYSIETEWNEDLNTYEDVLYRINIHTGYIDRYVLKAPEGLWAYLNEKD